MLREQDPSAAQGLIPPRPNLGPEPWPVDPPRPSVMAIAVLLVALLLLAAWWRRRARRSKAGRSMAELAPSPAPESDTSPRSRLIASAESVRSAIVDDLGPAWASKTTEELALEPRILGRLDAERAGRLVELLRISDRAKFAGEEPESVEEWEAWAGRLLEEWSAGPPSTDPRATSAGRRPGRAIGRR